MDVGDINLIQLLVQTGFAGLFVWLLVDVRREAKEREAKLLATLDKYANKLDDITQAIDGLKAKIDGAHTSPER